MAFLRAVWLAGILAACSSTPPPAAPEPAPTDPVETKGDEEPPSEEDSEGDMRVTDTGLGIEDITEGDGPEAKTDDRITVHFIGRLENGKVFDDSKKRHEPYTFTLGDGKVIAAWDEGIVGMKVGGVRRLTVPAKLGYGAAGKPPDIPPDALLEFEVELVAIE